MNLQRAWLLALSVSFSSAFMNTSPFFLFSTSRLTESSPSFPSLAAASSISDLLIKALSSCPSDTYIIISQPGVHASDFAAKHSSPNLRSYLNRTAGVLESWAVPEVIGGVDAESIGKRLGSECKADVLRIDATTGAIPNDGVFPRIVYVRFPALSEAVGERMKKLGEHDSFLHAVISEVGGDKYTVVYTTTPPVAGDAAMQRAVDYEMDDPFQSILHTDLKRDLDSHVLRANGSELALFDKYEFTSPAIFMGVGVFLILFMVLYVGITAVASLQVSYFAFSKEMGPQQKKQQ